MEASVVDLRYRMKDVLSALDRNERVTVTYRGQIKGVIVPVGDKAKRARKKMGDHPFVGMNAGDERSVQDVMDELRRPRGPEGGTR